MVSTTQPLGNLIEALLDGHRLDEKARAQLAQLVVPYVRAALLDSRLFVQAAGEGSGVVLIHPGLWDSRTWDDQWDPFAARHRVVRYDVRGYGRSSIPQAPYSDLDDLAAVMDAACTKALAPPQRRRLITMLEEQGVARDGARWLRRVERATLAALHERGEATAAELVTMVPDLGKKLTFGEGKTWGAEVGVSTRVLFLLATDGVIVRGRPRGSWLSSQYRWAPTDTWLGAPLDELDRDAASAEDVAPPCQEDGVAQVLESLLGAQRYWPVLPSRPSPGTDPGPGPSPTSAGGPGGRPHRRRPRSLRSTPPRSRSTTAPRPTCSPTTRNRSRPPNHGSRSCRASTRRSWVGRNATGTSASTRRRCSIATATRGRRCGPTGG